MANSGCPEGCGTCDTCGAHVCGGNCGDSFLDKELMSLFTEKEDESGIDMNVFSALAEFVALLTENVDMEVEILPVEGKRMIRSIVDAAVLMTLTEMAAMEPRKIGRNT